MPNVEVRLASRADEPTISCLMQLYIHDFSELWAGTGDGELQADGRPFLWEVAVARRNPGALEFWRRVIGGCALIGSIEEANVASAAWDRAILRFRAPSADNRA